MKFEKCDLLLTNEECDSKMQGEQCPTRKHCVEPSVEKAEKLLSNIKAAQSCKDLDNEK